MAERPIIFSTEMVRAILERRKTQTRRVIKPQPEDFRDPSEGVIPVKKAYIWYTNDGQAIWRFAPAFIQEWDPSPSYLYEYNCPYGQSGDHLWVRETWGTEIRYGNIKPSNLSQDIKIFYRTDGEGQSGLDRWRPSIHMPRWASRISLEVVNAWPERLNDISVGDIIAEGIRMPDPYSGSTLRTEWENLWDSINAKRGYGVDENPWVWAVEFKLLEE